MQALEVGTDYRVSNFSLAFTAANPDLLCATGRCLEALVRG